MGEPIAETRAGIVRGAKASAPDGTEFYSFKGISYAKPPIGDLRFREPQPVEAWTGIREATSHGPNCAQVDFFTSEVSGSDDCLYLNVATKSIGSKVLRPVMVWIHGGGFVGGSGDYSYYGPDYFMTKDIVFVSINYRLGVFGFLNLDDELAPGNQGLKDQVMALQWVRDNITNFGGNPDNVTIFGESAGSASVHYLTISPLAKGLFHKAICQSGVAVNPWAYHLNIKEKAYRLCEYLGHKEKDPKSIVQFLKTIDARKLAEAQDKSRAKEERVKIEFVFGPSIDLSSKTPFMPVHPEEAAANGVEVPMIIGYTSREGIIFLTDVSPGLDDFNNNIERALHPEGLSAIKKYYNLTPENFRRLYFNDDPVTKENLDKLADLVGDFILVEGIHRVIKNQVVKKRAPTYVYEFTYDKEPSFIKLMVKAQMSGASHAEELQYLFKAHMFDSQIPSPKKGSDKYKIIEQMIELWVNFATTGTPTPSLSELVPFKWLPVDDITTFHCLNICENLRMDSALDIGQQYIDRKYPKNKA